ncbi:hypothetical protein GCM10017690_25680 [Microbacterium terregens]
MRTAPQRFSFGFAQWQVGCWHRPTELVRMRRDEHPLSVWSSPRASLRSRAVPGWDHHVRRRTARFLVQQAHGQLIAKLRNGGVPLVARFISEDPPKVIAAHADTMRHIYERQ